MTANNALDKTIELSDLLKFEGLTPNSSAQDLRALGLACLHRLPHLRAALLDAPETVEGQSHQSAVVLTAYKDAPTYTDNKTHVEPTLAPQPPASAVDVEAIKCEIWQAIAEKHQNAQGDIRAATVIEVIDHLHQRGLIGQPVGGEDFQLEPIAQAIQNWGLDNGHTFIASEAEGLAETIRSILKHHARECCTTPPAGQEG